MPKMNGLELTKAIKSKEALAKTPVVLITSMTDSEYRKKGEDVGADAFFVKSSFDQSNLLDVIKNLI
jgi:two-component system chemotaxis sensor kinase CheA